MLEERMDARVLDYYKRVKNHIYSNGKQVYKIIGLGKNGVNVEVWYDVIFLDNIGNPDGIKVNQKQLIWLGDSLNKLQTAKNCIRYNFTRKSESIRKKYWTKLEKELKYELKG